MGVGKTDIGVRLAHKLGRRFVDLDRIIEQQVGMDIPTIFREHGEDYFRQLETSVLKNILSRGNGDAEGLIVSCGGGIVTGADNRRLLGEYAFTVWIEADISECLDRIKQGSRPLLMRADARAFAEKLYNQRVPLYTQTADLIVHTTGMDVETAAEEIFSKLTAGGHRKRRRQRLSKI